MDTTTVAWIFGPMFGVSRLLAPILIDQRRTRREQRTLAGALAALIEGCLRRTSNAGIVSEIHDMRGRLLRGEPANFRVGISPRPPVDAAWETHRERLGLLPSDLATKTDQFFGDLAVCRAELARLHHGEFDNKPADALALIEKGLEYWLRTEALGHEIVPALRKISG